MSGLYLARAQDDPFLRMLRMFDGTFSLDAAQMTSSVLGFMWCYYSIMASKKAALLRAI